MNNIVEIIYNKYEKHPKVMINGEELSRFVELADYIYDDIFAWVDKMYTGMDDELAEDYRVVLTGHPFQYEVLNAAKSLSQYCTEVTFSPLEYSIPLGVKFNYAKEVSAAYGIDPKASCENIAFNCTSAENCAEFEKYGVVYTEKETPYAIVADDESYKTAKNKYCVKVGEKVAFYGGRSRSLLCVTEEMLPLLLDYFCTYHVMLDYISEVFSIVSNMSLDTATKLEFEAYSKEEYRVYVSALPEKMDCGERFSVEYKVFPSCLPPINILVKSDDPTVIAAENGYLFAKGEGSCNITVSDIKGNVYETKNIISEKHIYVSNISIVIPQINMQEKETMTIKVITAPANAEDERDLEYIVSDDSVVAFSSKNELYALSSGRAKITVKTKRVSSSVYISVFPKAVDVALPGETVDVPISSEAVIQCRVVPANANPMPKAVWKSSNPRTVKIISEGDCKCLVRTYGVGYSVLTCSLENTDIQKNIRVNVVKEKGCYVATAVYGSYDCPEVWTLRRYRDNYLASGVLGRAFIKTYYAVSPTAVRWFGETKWFNKLWKSVLDKMVAKLKSRGYEDTPYQD